MTERPKKLLSKEKEMANVAVAKENKEVALSDPLLDNVLQLQAR